MEALLTKNDECGNNLELSWRVADGE